MLLIGWILLFVMMDDGLILIIFVKGVDAPPRTRTKKNKKATAN
jgi:hypothetical protein